MSLSLISGKSAFLHDGYLAAIKNCCVPMVVKRILYSVIAVERLVQYDMCYAGMLLLLGTSFKKL